MKVYRSVEIHTQTRQLQGEFAYLLAILSAQATSHTHISANVGLFGVPMMHIAHDAGWDPGIKPHIFSVDLSIVS